MATKLAAITANVDANETLMNEETEAETNSDEDEFLDVPEEGGLYANAENSVINPETIEFAISFKAPRINLFLNTKQKM